MSPPISGVIPSLNGRGNLTGDHFIDIEALVDTGATYTTTPGSMLVQLGIEPEGVRRFELARHPIIPTVVVILGISGRKPSPRSYA